MMKHLIIKIYGSVQGVFFRDSAKRRADELGLKGFVKNEPDGSVLIEAEGNAENLEKLIEWCRKGPDLAGPKKVEVKEGGCKNLSNFDIIY